MAANLRQFIFETMENGGCTYNLFAGLSPATGYAVSILKKQTTCKADLNSFTPYFLSAFIKEHAEKLAMPYNFLGSWIDDGQIYLDVVEVTDDLWHAKNVARQNNQLAIFDLGKMETIYL